MKSLQKSISKMDSIRYQYERFFFKDIKSPNDSHDPESENLNFSIDNDDEILNCHISENEILKCINNLKNNKAC